MSDEEVIIAPLLELCMVGRVMPVADLLIGAVEMLHVLLIEIRGGNVGTSSKPPLARQAIPLLCLKVSIVEVHCGGMRIARMHNGGDAGGEKGHTADVVLALKSLRVASGSAVCLRGHGAINHRHVHTGLLPDVPVLHHSGDSTASVLSCPGILSELGAINVLYGLANGVLGITDDLLKFGLGAAVCVLSWPQE